MVVGAPSQSVQWAEWQPSSHTVVWESQYAAAAPTVFTLDRLWAPGPAVRLRGLVALAGPSRSGQRTGGLPSPPPPPHRLAAASTDLGTLRQGCST